LSADLIAKKNRGSKDKAKLSDYVDDLVAGNLTVQYARGRWVDVHGDGKSSTKGKFNMHAMEGTDGKFIIRITEDGVDVAELIYNSEPELSDVVNDFKVSYG
jgi:hypothetical protein